MHPGTVPEARARRAGSEGVIVAEHEVRWCFHTTAMMTDYERTRDALIDLVGLRVLEDSRLEDPRLGRRGGMAQIADGILEIGEPIVEGGATDRFVKRFGSHMSSIALQVADIDATVAHLERHDVRVASRPMPEVVFTTPGDTAGISFEWYGGSSPRDPRWGGPLPDLVKPPLLDVIEIAFAGCVVADPRADARRLAELCGTAVTFVDEAAEPGHPVAGISIGDCTLALFPLPESEHASHDLWAWAYARPQAANLGLRVESVDRAADALAGAGVAITRRDSRMVVIDPAATGGVTLVLVEARLPSDPR